MIVFVFNVSEYNRFNILFFNYWLVLLVIRGWLLFLFVENMVFKLNFLVYECVFFWFFLFIVFVFIGIKLLFLFKLMILVFNVINKGL